MLIALRGFFRWLRADESHNELGAAALAAALAVYCPRAATTKCSILRKEPNLLQKKRSCVLFLRSSLRKTESLLYNRHSRIK